VSEFQQWAESHWRLDGRHLIRFTPWQAAAGAAMFPDDGSAPRWDTFLLSTVKKAGKTEFDACATGYAALTFPAPEMVYVLANDQAQAQDRVFDRIARAFRAMGMVGSGEAVITASEIRLRETDTRIVALPADFAGSSGAVFGVTSWTELWAYRHEGHVRLWEELTPIPNRRSLRIVDSYAGFAGDSPILEPMWQRALSGERLDPELPIYGTGRLWAYIDTGEDAQRRAWRGSEAEREAYYAEQRATLRPGTYARLHLNQWQSGEEAFLTADDWDACVHPALSRLPASREQRLYVGVDAATKHDSAAVMAVSREGERVRLAAHRIWTPKGSPLDLEESIEAYVLELQRDYRLAAVFYDPYQMARSAATLRKAGVPMEEYPQTTGNLTATGQNLYDLVRERRLVMYPDAELRRHALGAVAIETGRGWRIAKERASRKVDGVVALSFAALAAVTRHRAGRWVGDLDDQGRIRWRRVTDEEMLEIRSRPPSHLTVAEQREWVQQRAQEASHA